MIVKMSLIPGNKKGIVGKISVKVGDEVAEGDVLVQVETAKGNRPIKATASGKIKIINFNEGEEVASLAEMFEIEENNETITIDDKQDNDKIFEEIKTDLLILGAGPGGYVAAIYAAKKGLKVTLVEKNNLGGTCLNVGCIPTKALIKSSEVYKEIKHANIFGVDVKDAKFDLKKAVERKNKVKDRLVNGIDYLLKKNGVNLIKGSASFQDKENVLINGNINYLIKAENIIIATGSKVVSVPIPGLDLPMVLDSTGMLDNVELPKSLTIIGGGVIGMEFAFMYKNFGIEVNVVEYMDRVLSMVDKDISLEIEKEAKDININIHTGAKVTKIQKSLDNKAIITFEDKDGEHIIISDKVLSAIGRKANIDNLNLNNAGILIDEKRKFIIVDEYMKTNIDNIYAIGDVNNIMQLAHVASHQGIVAVDNILGKNHKMNYDAVPSVIFTDPEIASVGIGEDKAKQIGIDYKVGRFSYAGNGKALTMNQENGFIKIIKDNSTNKVIGASIIGPDASSLIATMALAINNSLDEEAITKTIFAHPTTSEVIHEAALDLGLGALHQ